MTNSIFTDSKNINEIIKMHHQAGCINLGCFCNRWGTEADFERSKEIVLERDNYTRALKAAIMGREYAV